MPTVKKTGTKTRTKSPSRSSRRKSSLRDKMIDVRDMDHPYVKMTVWGRSGSGKTYFCASMPKPLLMIGAEEGTNTIRKVEGITFLPISNVEEAQEALEIAREDEFASLVVDTGTSCQQVFLADHLGLDQMPAQSSWGLASREDYQTVSMQVKTFFRDCFSLPMHTVIIAQEREFETDDSTELISPSVGAELFPSTARWLYANSDYIVQTYIRERYIEKKIKVAGKTKIKKVLDPDKKCEFCLRMGPDAVYVTKWRAPPGTELPDMIVDPTFEKISEYL